MQPIQGLHHITAIASNPQANIDFYHNLLGQRLVKRTVNFDDPGTYHFYFADKVGTPGTVLTFFPWQHIKKGTRGVSEATAVAYNITSSSTSYWHDRLGAQGINLSHPETRFGQDVFSFSDPDGMIVELILNNEQANIQIWDDGPIPPEYALRGFHSVTAWVEKIQPTADLLIGQMGFEFVGQEEQRARFRAGSNEVGLYVDLVEQPGMPTGRMGAGSIHHIAFRTVDDPEQVEYREQLLQNGFRVTPIKDRQYFHSIYFRAPSGVLFEIATDKPGFLYDEPIEKLGMSLKLPSWLEDRRTEIEQVLPPIDTEIKT
jgi:glyoxalase family protein